MRKWAFPCNICNVDRLSGKGTLKSLNYVRTSFEQWKIPRNNLSIRTRTRLNWGFKCFSVKRRRINKNIERIFCWHGSRRVKMATYCDLLTLANSNDLFKCYFPIRTKLAFGQSREQDDSILKNHLLKPWWANVL